MKVVYFEKDIRNVTGFYYSIITSALEHNNVDLQKRNVASIKNLISVKRKDYALITDLRDFAKLYLLGHRRFIFWYQGVTPEEVYLMSGSKIRYSIFSFFEKLSLKAIKYKIGVSNYLFKHFEEKYNISLKDGSYFIMPCFNNLLNKDSFYKEGKYENNIFCYAGGTAVWQGFDEMVRIYGEIEKKHPNVFFRIYSKEYDRAKEIISKYKIKNYSVESLPPTEVDQALSSCKFGFIIRENNVINNVATPTKFGTYIGNGVIPIYTPAIKAFEDLSKEFKFLCCSTIDEIVNNVDDYLDTSVAADDVFNEYSRIFEKYYNRENYIERLSAYLNL